MKTSKRIERSPALAEIFRLFIKPIVTQMNAPYSELTSTSSAQDRIDLWFGGTNREVIACVTTRDLTFRGEIWRDKETPNSWMHGSSSAYKIKEGAILWVRIDERTKNHVEIESDDHVFRLTYSDWLVHSEHIREVF